MEDGSKREEYHDPDYPEAVPSTSKEKTQVLSEEDRVQRIRAVVRREFANELKYKEEEIDLIDKRMTKARVLLHQLRFALVNQYYMNDKLMLSEAEIQDNIAMQQDPKSKAEVSSILRNEQKRIHPSVRKLLGNKQTSYNDILSKKTSTRNVPRKDYSAMLKNYTVDEEKGTTFSKPETSKSSSKRQSTDVADDSCQQKRTKPQVDIPNLDRVLTFEESVRNKQKHRFRIIIGNTSKYAPASSSADKSTHKWLLYVRGPREAPDVSTILEGITVTLHHTYAPHNTIHIQKSPFHLSRRGWGEFPAKIELHFKMSHLNRPTTVEHTIKLDRQYTGVQTLGSETVVDVWLYSDQEMLKYEYKEEYDQFKPPTVNVPGKSEIPATTHIPNGEPLEIKSELTTTDKTWTDFENTFLNKELNVDDMLIKPKKEPIDYENENTDPINENTGFINENTPVIFENSVINENNDFRPLIKSVKSEPLDSYVKNDMTDVIIKHETVINEPIILTSNPKKRLVKYVDPNTGKIYYLEMDINLDIEKVQGIVINAINETKNQMKKANKNGVITNTVIKKNIQTTKKGISLLKPEFQTKDLSKKVFTHFHNDHCYMGVAWTSSVNVASNTPKKSSRIETICKGEVNYSHIEKFEMVAGRLCDVRQVVQSILRKLPLINKMAEKSNFKQKFPFVVESEEKFWKFDIIKRRHLEWSRAKLINRILQQNFKEKSKIWSTKHILTFARYHGYHPIKSDVTWTSYGDSDNSRRRETDFGRLYGDKISSLSILDTSRFIAPTSSVESEVINLTCDDVEVDVCGINDANVKVKRESLDKVEELENLPLESEEDRLRCYYIEKKCSDIGLELRNEDVGSGYSHSVIHKVLLKCVKMFAEDLIRSSVCRQRFKYNTSRHKGRTRLFDSAWDSSDTIELSDVFEALKSEARLKFLTQDGLAAEAIDYKEKL